MTVFDYAVATAFAVAGLYILLGCNRVVPGVRLLVGLACFAVTIATWRAAHQPWHWRWY